MIRNYGLGIKWDYRNCVYRLNSTFRLRVTNITTWYHRASHEKRQWYAFWDNVTLCLRNAVTSFSVQWLIVFCVASFNTIKIIVSSWQIYIKDSSFGNCRVCWWRAQRNHVTPSRVNQSDGFLDDKRRHLNSFIQKCISSISRQWVENKFEKLISFNSECGRKNNSKKNRAEKRDTKDAGSGFNWFILRQISFPVIGGKLSVNDSLLMNTNPKLVWATKSTTLFRAWSRCLPRKPVSSIKVSWMNSTLQNMILQYWKASIKKLIRD